MQICTHLIIITLIEGDVDEGHNEGEALFTVIFL